MIFWSYRTALLQSLYQLIMVRLEAIKEKTKCSQPYCVPAIFWPVYS